MNLALGGVGGGHSTFNLGKVPRLRMLRTLIYDTPECLLQGGKKRNFYCSTT